MSCIRWQRRFVLCFGRRSVSGLLVLLIVLPGALRLVPRFGIWASGSRVPFLDVEATRIAIIPIWKVLGGV
jgi:hypothetical protein